MAEFIILYGHGTPSAHVHRRASSQKEAKFILGVIREVWGRYADRFTLHPSQDVLEYTDDEMFVLKKTAFEPHSQPQKSPEGISQDG